MADSAEASSVGPAEGSSTGSGKQCTSCKKPVKDHVGPHGKDRCVWGVVETLRLRVVDLEKLVAANQNRHTEEISSLEARCAEELSRSDKLHQQRIDSLLVVVEAYQVCKNDETTALDHDRSDYRSEKADESGHDQKDAGCPTNSKLDQLQPESTPTFAKIVSSKDITLSSVSSSVSSSASSSSPNSETAREGEFTTVRRKRTLRTNRTIQRVQGGSITSSGTLCGSKRVKTKCYFLSGVSPDCTEEQIRNYCNKRSVQTTGCYILRSRNWGTQSAKLFVANDCSDTVEQTDFWPEFIQCRQWMRDPPGPNHRSENGEKQ